MSNSPLDGLPVATRDTVAAQPGLPSRPQPTATGQAALDVTQALGRKVAAPATLHAYKVSEREGGGVKAGLA